MRLVRLSGWTIGYVVANQLTLWLVLILAARTDGGAIAYLSAFLFFMLPYGVIAVSIATPIQPELARAAQADDRDGLRNSYGLGLRLGVLTMAFATAVLVVLAEPIVRLALGYGRFDASDVELTAGILRNFSFGLIGFTVFLYTLRVFYARQNTRTPFVLNAIENALNIALALALAPRFGVAGLALAFAVAYLVAAVIALFVVRREFGRLDHAWLAPVARALVAGTAAALAALTGLAFAAPVLSVAVGGVAAGLAFVAVLVLARGDELRAGRALLRRRSGAADSDPEAPRNPAAT